MPQLTNTSWLAALEGRDDPADVPTVVLVSPFSQDTGNSGAFQAVLSDARTCWVKPLNNRQSPLVPVADQIVGRCGALIDAPVCPVSIVRLPAELAGTEVFWGLRLEPGLAHASDHIAGTFETRTLGHRERDENAVRQAGIYALALWCLADDTEWLVSTLADLAYYSHDHGGYLGLAKPADPPSDPDDGGAALPVSLADYLLGSPVGLDRDALRVLAGRLRAVTRDNLVRILRSIPASWPISAERLAAVGETLQGRAGPVAELLGRLT